LRKLSVFLRSVLAANPRLESLAIVILGTLLFLVIVYAVGRGVAWAFQSPAAQSSRALVTVRLSGSMLGELVVLLVLIVFLRSRGLSLRDLGIWQHAPARGWIIAAVITALYLWMTFAAVLRGQAPLGEASFFHIYNSLVAGLVAGFVEEIFYRGFVMSELGWSGFGPVVQVIASGVLFGISHTGWGLFSGNINWPAIIGSISATAILGAAYAVAYRASRNSLMPVIAGHAITDILIEPWLLLAAVSGAMTDPH